MKRYLAFSLILFLIEIPTVPHAQNLEAQYKVEKTAYIDFNGKREKAAVLAFDGFLYQKNARTIYFQRPLYLSNYPDGWIIKTIDDSHSTGTTLPMDTLNHLCYMDFDSLIIRGRIEISGSKGSQFEFNYKQKLIKGAQTWKLMPEVKEINGLRCQHAIFSANGGIQWDVWFCPDIPSLSGPYNIQDLPGLVVDAYSPVFNETFVLTSYSTRAVPDDSVFWPAIFNQPFR